MWSRYVTMLHDGWVVRTERQVFKRSEPSVSSQGHAVFNLYVKCAFVLYAKVCGVVCVCGLVPAPTLLSCISILT